MPNEALMPLQRDCFRLHHNKSALFLHLDACYAMLMSLISAEHTVNPYLLWQLLWYVEINQSDAGVFTLKWPFALFSFRLPLCFFSDNSNGGFHMSTMIPKNFSHVLGIQVCWALKQHWWNQRMWMMQSIYSKTLMTRSLLMVHAFLVPLMVPSGSVTKSISELMS